MKCEVCKLATITYVVHKMMILCEDCYYWIKYDEEA